MTFQGLIKTQADFRADWGLKPNEFYAYSDVYGVPYDEQMAHEDFLMQKQLLEVVEEDFLERINWQEVVATGYY